MEIKGKDPRDINISNESIQISKERMPMKVQFKVDLDVSLGQDIIMIFPVTSSVCLLGFSDSGRHTIFMNRLECYNNIIGFINLMTLNQCNKAVYSHSKELLMETWANVSSFRENNFTSSFEVGIQ